MDLCLQVGFRLILFCLFGFRLICVALSGNCGHYLKLQVLPLVLKFPRLVPKCRRYEKSPLMALTFFFLFPIADMGHTPSGYLPHALWADLFCTGHSVRP